MPAELITSPMEERFKALQNRQVGFELFDPRIVEDQLRRGDYVAMVNNYVLIGFKDKLRAEKLFTKAMEATL
jgi:hypothetical protein